MALFHGRTGGDDEASGGDESPGGETRDGAPVLGEPVIHTFREIAQPVQPGWVGPGDRVVPRIHVRVELRRHAGVQLRVWTDASLFSISASTG